jgi:hypothetical protein
VISFFEIGHSYEAAVIAVGPAVISAGEARGVACVGAAQPIAAVPADIEKGAHPAAGVADHQNRVLTHVSGQEIAGLRDLALVAQIEPAAREYPLQFLLINLRLDKDTAADEAVAVVDQLA